MYTSINEDTIVKSCAFTLKKSKDPQRRWLSLIVLRLAGDMRDDHMDRLFKAAERVLKKDPSVMVRQASMWVLRSFPDRKALNMLNSGLSDKDWEVRFEAVDSLASLASIWEYYDGYDDYEVNDQEQEEDNDEKKEVKNGEKKNVKRDGSVVVKSAISGLLVALKDNQPEVRLRAAFHLSRLNPCKVRSEIKKMIPERTEY
jgi:HEAT repeat protein